MGCSSRSKRCFTKMWGFSNRFHPPHPFFFFLLKMSEKSSTGYWTPWASLGENWREIMQTFLYLTECGQLPLPAPFLSAWSSVEQHGPSMLEKQRQGVCVRVWLLICFFETKQAHIRHRIPLQSLAKAGGSGMDPFELSVLLLFAPEPCS